MRARDSQRQKVYNAEEVLKREGVPTLTLDEVKELVMRVRMNSYLRIRYELQLVDHIEVTDGRMRRRGGGFRNHIAMPRWTRQDWYVLHELSHTITQRKYGTWSLARASHGWEFCSVYLDLVRFILGRDTHDKLKQSFKDHKVRFRAKARRAPMSEGTKALLRARLVTARAAIGQNKETK